METADDSSPAVPTASVECPRLEPTDSQGSAFLVTPDSSVDPVVSVVLPTMNEAEGIGICLDRLSRAIDTLELPTEIIVSDSSTDRTPEIASQRGATVVTPNREGYGYAYRCGFAAASGEFVVIGDADTTYDFEELPALFERLEATDADMVLGSRLAGTIEPGAMPPLHRYIGNPVLTWLLNAFYDAGVSDAHSGFRVIRREVLADLDLRTDGMEFASEMIMEAASRGYRIEEVPITYHERVGEATLDSFQDGWRHVRFMLLNAPGYIFTGPAVACIGLGVLTLAASLLDGSVGGVVFGDYTAIAGSLLVVLGYQIGSLTVFSSASTTPIRPPGDPLTDRIRRAVTVERGLIASGTLFALGGGYAVSAVGRWVASGNTLLPAVPQSMVAFSAIVLGLQTAFVALYLGVLDECGTDMDERSPTVADESVADESLPEESVADD
ncbi:MAG: glycosyltransferase family 2 protein [Halohasta sp.]